MINRHHGDVVLQYQKGELSREEATDKIICCALKSKKRLFKQGDDDGDDDVQGAAGGEDTQGEESGNEEFFDTSDVWSPEDREREKFNYESMQTDKVLDLITNTTPAVAQQADIHNFRTTTERKPTKRFTPPTYNQQKTKKKNKNGSEKRKRYKIRQAESEKEKEDEI